MGDGDDDHYEVEVSSGINKIVEFLRVRFKSRLFLNDNSK